MMKRRRNEQEETERANEQEETAYSQGSEEDEKEKVGVCSFAWIYLYAGA